MSRRIILLLVAVVLLGGVFYQLAVRKPEDRRDVARALLPNITPTEIASLQIVRGSEQVQLSTSGGRWFVDDRSGYAADMSKITALMLKLFDLHVNDSTKMSNADLAELGLADDSFKQGFLKLTLLRPDKSPIVSIFAGKGRKEDVKAFAKPMGGQFVRSSASQDAYLAADPISVSAAPRAWIDVNLLNVLQTSIHSVVQSELKDAAPQEQFRLLRSDITKDVSPIGVEIKPEISNGRTYEESVLTQLRAILENTKIDDVRSSKDEEVANLKFDRLTTVGTREGAVYSIYTAEKGSATDHRIFARVEVSFDQKIVDEVQSALLSSPRAADQKALTVASAAEIQQINELFKPWVYELPPYQGQKFRFSLNDLFVVSRPVNILKRE